MIFGFQETLDNPYYYFKQVQKLYNTNLRESSKNFTETDSLSAHLLNTLLLKDNNIELTQTNVDLDAFEKNIQNIAETAEITKSDTINQSLKARIYYAVSLYSLNSNPKILQIPSHYLRSIYFGSNQDYQELDVLSWDDNLMKIKSVLLQINTDIKENQKTIVNEFFKSLLITIVYKELPGEVFTNLKGSLFDNYYELKVKLDQMRLDLMEIENLTRTLIGNQELYSKCKEKDQLPETPKFPIFYFCSRAKYDQKSKSFLKFLVYI